MKLQPQASASGPGNGWMSTTSTVHSSLWLAICVSGLWGGKLLDITLPEELRKNTAKTYVLAKKRFIAVIFSYRLCRRPVVIEILLAIFSHLGVLLGFCLSPCSIFFPTSWSSTVPHPVLASRNVFMPCATERLTRSWFRWSFRQLSSTRCILWNAPLPSNCRKWSLSSESPILKNVISSWWWPFHPGCGEHPYLPQTLPLTSPQPQPLTRSFELNLSAGQIGAIGRTSKRIHPSTDPKISQVMPQNLKSEP